MTGPTDYGYRGEGDLNPQTSHALGGNPTVSALGTDTDGSGGNQYKPAIAASGTSPLATSAANGSHSGSLGKVPQVAFRPSLKLGRLQAFFETWSFAGLLCQMQILFHRAGSYLKLQVHLLF